MKYFTDSPFEKMMMQKPSACRDRNYPPSKHKPPKKDKKRRELIIIHENKEDKEKN